MTRAAHLERGGMIQMRSWVTICVPNKIFLVRLRNFCFLPLMNSLHPCLVDNQGIILISGTVYFVCNFFSFNVCTCIRKIFLIWWRRIPWLSSLRNTCLHVENNRNHFNLVSSYFFNCKLSLHNYWLLLEIRESLCFNNFKTSIDWQDLTSECTANDFYLVPSSLSTKQTNIV